MKWLSALSSFSPLGFLSGISIKGWITIAAIVVLIGLGFAGRYLWLDYQSLMRENGKQEEQNQQLENANKDLASDAKKGNESKDKSNEISEKTFIEKKLSDDDLRKFIEDKNDKLDNVPLKKPKRIYAEESTEDAIQPAIDATAAGVEEKSSEEIIKARSTIRYELIHKAYCSTKPGCI